MSLKKYKKLHDACWTGNLETVMCFVSKGANIHMDNERVLRSAVVRNHLKIVKYLVSECAANIHIYNDNPVRTACESGYLKMAKYLISKGADIHAIGGYALREASRNGHLKIVQYLVSQCSANIHADYEIAARVAALNYSFGIVRYLVSHGASVSTILRYLIKSELDYYHLEIVAYLLSWGATDIFTIPKFYLSYADIWARGQERRRIRTQKRIYFWWIRRCFDMSAPSGIRMCLSNLDRHEKMCAS
jgi:hypothetical protein